MRFINAKEALQTLIQENPDFELLQINIQSRALKNEEAIGNPDRKDFPLLTGKEVLLQADIEGFRGQAFTGDPVEYHGTLQSILLLPDDRPGNNALMVAALNALMSKMGKADHTIHCMNNEPEECALQICNAVYEKHGRCRVGIIGYQPSILERCTEVFGSGNVWITDLNKNNIGDLRYGVPVLDGFTETGKLIEFADVLLVTGTILANGTASPILSEIKDKPVYFYGTTCSGLAVINDYKRLCPLSGS